MSYFIDKGSAIAASFIINYFKIGIHIVLINIGVNCSSVSIFIVTNSSSHARASSKSSFGSAFRMQSIAFKKS